MLASSPGTSSAVLAAAVERLLEGYPEPDYTDLARGRILHVFKDRGGLEDETEPVPSEDTGVLVGV